MKYGNAARLTASVLLALCLFSSTGCWQQRLAQQRALAAQAAVMQADAARAAAEAVLQAARTKGIAAAANDTGNDTLKLKEYPPMPPPPWHAKYVQRLKEHCNAEWEVVQGPADSDALREEVNAYNEVMRVEIERRFGVGILEKLRAEAQGK
jgi:hypothetical protein